MDIDGPCIKQAHVLSKQFGFSLDRSLKTVGLYLYYKTASCDSRKMAKIFKKLAHEKSNWQKWWLKKKKS